MHKCTILLFIESCDFESSDVWVDYGRQRHLAVKVANNLFWLVTKQYKTMINKIKRWNSFILVFWWDIFVVKATKISQGFNSSTKKLSIQMDSNKQMESRPVSRRGDFSSRTSVNSFSRPATSQRFDISITGSSASKIGPSFNLFSNWLTRTFSFFEEI